MIESLNFWGENMDLICLFGGASFEHEVSIVSAISLKDKLHFSHFIFLDSSNRLFLIPKDSMQSLHFSSQKYQKDSEVFFAQNGFIKHELLKKRLICGLVVNLIHGKMGEDGIISSLLEFYKINYIGPRIEASAISFNKIYTKLYAKARGIRVIDYEIIYQNSPIDIENLAKKLPLILKPARLGSSIGIVIAKNKNELKYGLDSVFEYDSVALVEEFIPSVREFNLAGVRTNNGLEFSMIEEVSKGEMLDFEKKYLDFGMGAKNKEANIDEAIKQKFKDAFLKIYENCFEGALIRCDFFLIDDCVVLNEINPVPGSLANYLFSDFGGVFKRIQLPKSKQIPINYKYIAKIQANKGRNGN